MTPLNVACILVNRNNFSKWWPLINKSLKDCDFIAIDLEFSGLGTKDPGASNQIDDRYLALKEIASTRAILSMGLACFKIHGNKGYFSKASKSVLDQIIDCLDQQNNGDQNEALVGEESVIYVTVEVYNFICMCQNDFVIEPKSMDFLVSQGFDFNELSKSGIHYSRGKDPSTSDEGSPSLRSLLSNIICLKLPVVFHNGLHDMVFLYQSFYSELPNKLSTFVSDLYEMFPNGIFDTKHIASSTQSGSSYLEYLFHRSQRKNIFRQFRNQTRLSLEFNQFTSELASDVNYFDLTAKIMQQTTENKSVCDNYAKYGWCEKQDSCFKSHNIDLILDHELKLKKDKRNRSLISRLVQIAQSDPSGPNEIAPMRKLGSHHSGCDAFMTAYCFIFHILSNFNKASKKEFLNLSVNLRSFKNKIFLSGRTPALNIIKSAYASTSKSHDDKFNKINETKGSVQIDNKTDK